MEKSQKPSEFHLPSFMIDHDSLLPGLYHRYTKNSVSTWDIRFHAPNTPGYPTQATLHSLEHLIAHVSKSISTDVISFNCGMCATCGYLEVVPGSTVDSRGAIIGLIQRCLDYAKERGIPGVHRKECGNFRCHSLKGALALLTEILEVQLPAQKV